MNSESKNIKESYKNTIGWWEMFKVGATFLVTVFVGVFIANYNKFNTSNAWIKYCVFIFVIIGIIFIIPSCIFFVFETIKIAVPVFTKPINFFIKIISKLFLFFKTIYIGIVKLVIGEAVRNILSEREKGRELDFIFKNQNDDDHYYPENIDLNKENIKIKVVPKDTIYWRIGFKFSNSEVFGVTRHGMDLPLFHIGEGVIKDSRLGSVEKENTLHATYYNKDYEREYNKDIIVEYKGELVAMEVFKNNNSAVILVRDDSGNEIARENVGDYRLCKLFAWGDKKNYTLQTKIWKESK